MFDKSKLKKVLVEYKALFVQKQWPEEKYKWEAIKHFQDHWNIEAVNFGDMFKMATVKAGNLLGSGYAYPRDRIIKFAKVDDEGTRDMFRRLFNESINLAERIREFQVASENMYRKHNDGTWGNHYQNTNAISTYLWMMFPDKYYIYKYELFRDTAIELEADYKAKRDGSVDTMIGGFRMYDEICGELQQDDELKNLLSSQLTDTCYPDPELHTLTIDVGFFISRYFNKKEDATTADEWWPQGYTPAFSADDWEALLKDNEVFTDNSLEIMRRMLDYGGKATCTQLSIKYGESKNFYNVGSSALAKRVVEKTGCPVMTSDDDRTRCWPVLYVGKKAKKEEDGSFVWKLRDELKEALKRIDLSQVKLYVNSTLTQVAKGNEKYDKEKFLEDVYMTENQYDRLVAVLKKKKNIILQGAPGVGKTFAAQRLAYAVLGEVDDDRIEFVQFHQNYSYEDFIMGYKPVADGFELKYGIFYRFCQKAANHPDKDYFFIIDEINRGNMSKIFGELLMLIEADYRDKKAILAYNGLSFSVPKRLHIIGMMNTADRSLAMIDYALRRRFSFFDMEPGFESEGFMKYQKEFKNETFDSLIKKIKELNREIMQDKTLGKEFCIGHSYFCNVQECTEDWMKDVVDFDILPMLGEYWFDDANKLQRWENLLHGIFQ